MSSHQSFSKPPNQSSPLPEYLQSDDVHCWSTSPLQTDPRIVRVPGTPHAFASHRSVETYRHPPVAEECGLRLVHHELGCVVPPDGEATEVVMDHGKRVKVYDAFNYVIVSNHGSEIFGISRPTCIENDVTCTLSTWFRGCEDDGTRLIDGTTGMEMAIMGDCVGCTQAGRKCALSRHDLFAMTSMKGASGIAQQARDYSIEGGGSACRDVKSLNLSFISSDWLGTRKPVLTSKQFEVLVRLKVQAKKIKDKALVYTLSRCIRPTDAGREKPVQEQRALQNVPAKRYNENADPGENMSSAHLCRSVKPTTSRPAKRVRSDFHSKGLAPTSTLNAPASATSGPLLQDQVPEHILSLALISNRSVDDAKKALGQLAPNSGAIHVFAALLQRLKGVGEHQVASQATRERLERQVREATTREGELNTKLAGSMAQAKKASDQLQLLRSACERTDKVWRVYAEQRRNKEKELQAEVDKLQSDLRWVRSRLREANAKKRSNQVKTLQAQVEQLKVNLGEVKGDLREANDTIMMCDRELRAVRAERAKRRVVKAEC